MRFTNAQLFRLVAWCSLIALSISLAGHSVTFLVATGLAFLFIPYVLRGIIYSTAESWLLTMILSSGLLCSIGLSSKFIFQLDSPTFLHLFAGTFLFWAVVTLITPDAEKNPIRRHRLELLIPAILGFGCIFMSPIVAFPGGNIPSLLQLACLIALCLFSTLYVWSLQIITKSAG